MINTQQFQYQLEQISHDFRQKTFLLAVSGGVDSMVLAYLFKKLNISFQIAHINYHLRKEDSNLDQKLVENFCLENQIPLHIYEISQKDQQPEGSIQLWARNIRYQFFQKTMLEQKLDILATAHHLNDQIETFFINLSRGSGIKGLSGIPNSEKVMRPLLHFTKEEIYQFAKENNIDFREDYSNQKNDYLRNKIRNTIVPKLTEINHFVSNFDKSMQWIQQTKDFAVEQAELIFQKISKQIDDTIILQIDELQKESKFVQYYILEKFDFKNPEENDKVFVAQTGSTFHSKTHTLSVNRNEIIISNRGNSDINIEEEIILIQDKSDLNQEKTIHLKDFFPEENFNIQWKYDAENLDFPLRLRKKKEGDLFSPIGMIGKKKVSKFFKDEKFSILAKQKTWIIVDGKDRILGILPYRQDQRFASTQDTVEQLTIQY